MEKTPMKIGLLGEIRAGKDTVAEMIHQEALKQNGSTTINFAFANGIHEVIRKYFPDVYLQGKPRKHLQIIGESFRELNPFIWIDYLIDSYEYSNAILLNKNILITDVRQPNEVKRLQKEGYKIIKVTADKAIRFERAKALGDNFDPKSLEHETERVVASCPYDYLIDNSGTLSDTKKQLIDILREVST